MPALLHLHIPKTGGTTLFDLLRATIGDEGVWEVTTDHLTPEVIATRAPMTRLISGHLSWAAAMAELERLTDADATLHRRARDLADAQAATQAEQVTFRA